MLKNRNILSLPCLGYMEKHCPKLWMIRFRPNPVALMSEPLPAQGRCKSPLRHKILRIHVDAGRLQVEHPIASTLLAGRLHPSGPVGRFSDAERFLSVTKPHDCHLGDCVPERLARWQVVEPAKLSGPTIAAFDGEPSGQRKPIRITDWVRLYGPSPVEIIEQNTQTFGCVEKLTACTVEELKSGLELGKRGADAKWSCYKIVVLLKCKRSLATLDPGSRVCVRRL